MTSAGLIAAIVLLLILARWAAQLWLEQLNRRHVLAHAGAVPEAFKGVVDEATYAKSVQYTLAKGRLDQIEATWSSGCCWPRCSAACCPGAFRLHAMAGQFGVGDGGVPACDRRSALAAGPAVGLV